MRYILDLHLKTKMKRVGVYSTFDEARRAIEGFPLKFKEMNYYGGNPIFTDYKDRVYSLSGAIRTDVGTLISCAIPVEEAKWFERQAKDARNVMTESLT